MKKLSCLHSGLSQLRLKLSCGFLLLPSDMNSSTTKKFLEIVDLDHAINTLGCHTIQCEPLLQPLVVLCGQQRLFWTQAPDTILFFVYKCLYVCSVMCPQSTNFLQKTMPTKISFRCCQLFSYASNLKVQSIRLSFQLLIISVWKHSLALDFQIVTLILFAALIDRWNLPEAKYCLLLESAMDQSNVEGLEPMKDVFSGPTTKMTTRTKNVYPNIIRPEVAL